MSGKVYGYPRKMSSTSLGLYDYPLCVAWIWQVGTWTMGVDIGRY